jgi:hypothetical protein
MFLSALTFLSVLKSLSVLKFLSETTQWLSINLLLVAKNKIT